MMMDDDDYTLFQFSSPLSSDSIGFQLSSWGGGGGCGTTTNNDHQSNHDDTRSTNSSTGWCKDDDYCETLSFTDPTFALEIEDPISRCLLPPRQRKVSRTTIASVPIHNRNNNDDDDDSVQYITWKRNGCYYHHHHSAAGRVVSSSSSTSRRVRFCLEPPQIHSIEKSDRNDYAVLYYSAHELQKMIDDSNRENCPIAAAAASGVGQSQ